MNAQALSGRLLRAQDRLRAAEATSVHNPCPSEREWALGRVVAARSEIVGITKTMERRLRQEPDPPEAA
jgi:hypothetical protein